MNDENPISIFINNCIDNAIQKFYISFLKKLEKKLYYSEVLMEIEKITQFFIKSNIKMDEYIFNENAQEQLIVVMELVKKKHFKNILLSGAPGTGKTTFLRYIAKEFYENKDWPIVLFGSFFNQYKDHKAIELINFLAEEIIKKLESGQNVLFCVDEFDAILSNKKKEIIGEIFLQQIKKIMYYSNSSKGKFMIIFTTNHPEKINASVSSIIGFMINMGNLNESFNKKLIEKKIEKLQEIYKNSLNFNEETILYLAKQDFFPGDFENILSKAFAIAATKNFQYTKANLLVLNCFLEEKIKKFIVVDNSSETDLKEKMKNYLNDINNFKIKFKNELEQDYYFLKES